MTIEFAGVVKLTSFQIESLLSTYLENHRKVLNQKSKAFKTARDLFDF